MAAIGETGDSFEESSDRDSDYSDAEATTAKPLIAVASSFGPKSMGGSTSSLVES